MRFIILLLPLLELITLIQLGVETSALTAVFYVLATVALGLAVLRRQGQQIFARLQRVQQGAVLGKALMVDELAMGLAGLLLVFPGMISDFVALLVMIGPLRRRLARSLGGPEAGAYVPGREGPGRNADSKITIDGEYTRVDEDEKM